MRKSALLLLVIAYILNSCGTIKNENLEYYSFETECLGVELDGSQTVRAWGLGKNNADAIEQAKKNALRDVLFNGIRNGKSDCNLVPLVVEVNAQKKYAKYFYNFFSNYRVYSKYISSRDGSFKEKHSSENEVTYAITLRILNEQLKNQLIKDKIINK
jgi:hypothetical protein